MTSLSLQFLFQLYHLRKTFEKRLGDTLERLREKYPDAAIVYLIPFNQAQSAAIASAMKDVENGYVVETKDWEITYTDGTHPDAAGAKAAGEQLASALQDIFGEEFFTNTP